MPLHPLRSSFLFSILLINLTPEPPRTIPLYPSLQRRRPPALRLRLPRHVVLQRVRSVAPTRRRGHRRRRVPL
ncbi:hypothetical protein GGR52DRAFT_563378 [Hypoxylon sp. FL1284]|nr:hypothetical protein GGR52DRAFT_563378 [Hypoxylon sp. FL1284]